MFDSNQNNAYGAYTYNPQQNGPTQTRQPSVLTQEEYDHLRKEGNPFSLTLTTDEYLRGICNHRTPDGSADTLVQDPDGTVRCTTCGWEFNPIDTSTSDADIEEAVKLVTDILQTIKLLYISMPVETQREYFQIIPLISKIPTLFKMAVDDFSKHENYTNWNWRNGNMGTMNLFNMLTGALSGQQPYGYNPYGYAQPPYGQQYNAPYGQQPYNGAPQQTVNPGQPLGSAPPMSNGFGYPGGAPQMQPGYQPQMQGYSYNPQPQAPYQQTAAPSQPGTQNPTETTSETDGQNVTTQATFKA